MGAFRHEVFKTLIDADVHKRLRLVYPAASRAQNVPTFVHSKVMVVDDVLVRIGSANFSRRSMGVDTECDLAVEARDARRPRRHPSHPRSAARGTPQPDARGRSTSAPARRVALRAHRLAGRRRTHSRPDRAVAQPRAAASEALRAVADPEEPMAFGPSVAELVPPADATNGLRPIPSADAEPAITLPHLAAGLGCSGARQGAGRRAARLH